MMSISNGNINENSNGVEPIRILNPFVHKLEVNNPLDQLKTVILTILLLPFRVISICLLLVIAWLLACIGLYGLNSDELQTKPLTGWRRRLKNVICIVGRWSYLAGGIGITVKGQQVHRNQAPILVIAPHSTFLDSVIVYVTRMSSVIVRNESMDNFAGKLINFTQPIYVWRDDPNSRHNTIQSIIDRANSKDDWPQILIFPEGTCTNRSCLITFKPGAFYPGVPIQPVCIRYPNKLDTVTWTWEGPGVLKLLWLTLTQFHSSCEVEFLPVYHPSDEEKINPKLFAHNVRNVMAKALGIPTSEYTYDDVRRLTRCKLMNNPYASSIVEIEKLRIKSGLHLTNIEEQVITLVNDNNCHVTLSEFALRLQIPPTDPATITLYAIFKKSNSDTIDFREYLLCALYLLKMNEPTIKLMHFVFKMYENCGLGQGRLSQTAFYGALKNTLASSIDESNKLFMEIDKDKRGYVTYDEFRLHLEQKMECSKLFDPSDYRPSSAKVKLN